MLKVKLQINRNMATLHADKPQDQKYRMIIERPELERSTYFYFTREELYAFTDKLVDLVSRLPTIENDNTIMGLEAEVTPPTPTKANPPKSRGKPGLN